MASTTVRISMEVREVLRELSRETGEPIQRILAEAIEAYRRQHILQVSNRAYADLRSDAEAWKEENLERAEWEITLADHREEEC